MPRTAAEPPTLELHFKRPGWGGAAFERWLFVLLAALVGLGFGVSAAAPELWDRLRDVLLVAGGSVAALLLFAAWRARSRPVLTAPLSVYPTHLEVPNGAGSARTRRVEYEDILALNKLGQPPREVLFLETPRALLSYPLRLFDDPRAFERLRDEVYHRMAHHPSGDRLLHRIARREASGRAAWARRPRVTSVLLGALVAGFVVPAALGAQGSLFGLVRFGANAPALVAEGQWFRLFSANFLHAGTVHLLMNGMGLWALGSVLERLIGSARFLSIYLLSAIGGALASALVARAVFSVGASTAIFGLLGGLALLNWRFRTELPAGFRQPLRWWVTILGLNAALPLLVPQIDVAAHAGGFLAGALAAALLCPRRSLGAAGSGRGAPLLAAALTAVFALALGQAALHASSRSGADQLELEQALVSDRSSDPQLLNEIAWYHVIDPAATRGELELAERAASSAAALEPESLEIQDTLATAYYRLGQLERAIGLERQVYARRHDRFTASQVARFLETRLERSGALRLGEGASPADVELVLPSSEEAEGAPARLRLEEELAAGAEVWLLARRSGELAGAYVLRIGPGGAGERPLQIQGARSEWADPDVQLVPALLDATSCGGCAPGSVEGRFHPLDPAARELPRATLE